ncbi:hypothetical protein HDU76_003090 [Blyttiomyces sp. JEL0837]|nr:hypothetical protein HDU76_003090 [Blyttiomyces sp. JEL0837]
MYGWQYTPRPRCLKGNWLEHDVLEEDKLKDFVDQRNKIEEGGKTLTWITLYRHLKTLNCEQIHGPLPSDLVASSGPATRLADTDGTPRVRIGSKVNLVNKGSGFPEACLTFDAWTKSMGQPRVMVGETLTREHIKTARMVFEVVPYNRDGTGHRQRVGRDSFSSERRSSSITSEFLCYGQKFRLVTMVSNVKMAVKLPPSTVSNLPGGSDTNLSLILTEDIGNNYTIFMAEPSDGKRDPLTPRPIKLNESFSLFCASTGQTVQTQRAKKLLTLVDGNHYSVISTRTTGRYQKTSAADWMFR